MIKLAHCAGRNPNKLRHPRAAAARPSCWIGGGRCSCRLKYNQGSHLHSQHIQLFKKSNKDRLFFPPFAYAFHLFSLFYESFFLVSSVKNLPQLNDMAQSQTSKICFLLTVSACCTHVNEGKSFTEPPVGLHISPSHTQKSSFFFFFFLVKRKTGYYFPPQFNHSLRMQDMKWDGWIRRNWQGERGKRTRRKE